MTGEIAVVVETIRGEVTEASYATLAAGRQLADGLRTRLWAVLLGYDVQKLAPALGAADRRLLSGAGRRQRSAAKQTPCPHRRSVPYWAER